MATVALTGDWLASRGNRRATYGKITFSNSYTTGGESITPAALGLGVVDNLDFNTGISGLLFVWDKANNKVKVFYPTGGAVVGTVLGAPKSATGASTASAVNATTPDISAGQGVEVAATTDLHTVIVDFEAVGR